MPCEKYKSPKQRNLCFMTNGWKDFSKVRNINKPKKKKK